tara:strand:+ start:2412 stop:2630 length:219 start_codon:yes stop_codon:yes gene_type:complete
MDMKLITELYDNMLDECYPTIKLGHLEYAPSVALYRLDPIAYRVGLSDYESDLRTEYEEDGSYQELFGDEEE